MSGIASKFRTDDIEGESMNDEVVMSFYKTPGSCPYLFEK